MKFIALDISLIKLTIIVADNFKVLFNESRKLKKNKVGMLFSGIEKALQKSKKEFKDLDYIFCTRGPGNFNGIRISLSMIRGLAIGNNIVAGGLSTMECLARSIETNKNICVGLKAYPEHVYIQWYDNNYNKLTEPELKNINEKLSTPLKNKNFIIVGDECTNLAKNLKFEEETKNLYAPSYRGLFNSVKSSLKLNVIQPPVPIYLRAARATPPLHWKKPPVIE